MLIPSRIRCCTCCSCRATPKCNDARNRQKVHCGGNSHTSQSDLVFVRKDRKTPLSKWTLDKQQARLRKTLHLPWDATIHSFRHSVATRLGLSGADPFTMQKLMGWSSITIAQKYVHPTPEATRAAMRRLKEFDDQMKARESRRKPVPVKVPTSKKSAAK